MATPRSKETELKIDDKNLVSSAGSSGDGGDEATPPQPPRLPLVPAPSPSHDPTAHSTSTPLLQPVRQPPPPIGKDTNEGSANKDLGARKADGDWEMEDVEIVDDEDCEGEKVTDSSDSKFFCTLFMSGRRNIPHYILRFDSAPLNKYEYFSRRKNWNQLLDGKRTYLRPCKGCPVLKKVFRRPDSRKKTLGCQKPLSELVRESSNNQIIQDKIKILSQHYLLFRRTRKDGSCFYRALLFSYLENLGQMQDSLAEVTRLMECVEMSREKFSRLKWDKAYFLNPEEYLSSVVSEFYHLVNSVANGLSSDKLYERSLEEMTTLRILSFLRLLTEIEIRTQEVYRSLFISEGMNVIQFCLEEVRPLDAEALLIQMRALTRALGVPLRVEVVDKSLVAQAVQVKHLDFFPPSESGKGPHHLTESYHSSGTAPKILERGRNDNLLSSDGTPLLTLLRRRGRCDILYPQVNKLC
ncbi:ubiquitin thioesterase otubain-like [Brachypodium distachyon]|uniref:OTU domain-containing protein n=1 Tax=Brachypodium distachyon TaxID=15368 RepID=A0A2K2CG56_BRADI|nr:ubiquitin thioesterase otubain-like [Brachypodium distachyon]PNT61014.1 hypothetical protein BRADI_5g09066v3 [Brachypodium distachyon]|eukprot:XP_003581186.1 ubiquitin thioesterase otubain-like [Brachypodium distachyon]